MFKNIDFSETSSNATPCDSDNETEGKLSPSTSRLNPNMRQQNLGNEDVKIQKLDTHTHVPTPCARSAKSPSPNPEELPKFSRRPLSDTPIMSTLASPTGSAGPSPPSSTTSLQGLDKKLNAKSALHKDVIAHRIENEPDLIEESEESDTTSKNRFSFPKRRPTTIDVPGQTKSKSSPDGMISKEDSGSKLVIVMVGLPATGKSFITNKLSRYLNYALYYCKVFNVGNTRRRYTQEHHLTNQDSNFFDPNNSNSANLRNKWALDTLDELLDYLLESTGSVGIFDATNTTKCRRKMVLEHIRKRSPNIKVLFLESVCTNRSVVENNIKLKLFGPDYKGKDPDKSLKDFKERLSNYLKAYEPIEDEENIQYIKMIDVGKKITSYKIEGFLASQTVYYLLNFNLTERQIWITRNGECEDNVQGKLGGNSRLTSRGIKYAKALSNFIDEQRYKFYQEQIEKRHHAGVIKSKDDIVQNLHEDAEDDEVESGFYVWTSMRTRAIQTAQFFNDEDYPVKQMKMLDELNAGDYEGMTYKEILDKFPEEFVKRQNDKIRYRYPGIAGESYMDVINRLRPVITELERIEESALIVTHRVVARALLGYFMNLNIDVISNLDVPLHCVYCLEPKPYGITWSLWEYNDETDSFSEVPQSDLNTTKVPEVGLVDKERRFSVVPTAPPTSDLRSSDFLRRRASVSFSGRGIDVTNKVDQSKGRPSVLRSNTSENSNTGIQTGNSADGNPLLANGIHKSMGTPSSSLLRQATNNQRVGGQRNGTHHPVEMSELARLNDKLAQLCRDDKVDSEEPPKLSHRRDVSSDSITKSFSDS